MMKPKFYKPTEVTQKFGAIYDMNGDEVDIKERGLNSNCITEGVDKESKHFKKMSGRKRLMLPPTEGQKEYLLCLQCGELSHF